MSALVSSMLLASDPIFLLANCFDWGPVALQILLTVAGFVAVGRFDCSGQAAWLYAGFALFGIAVWSKVLIAWTLVGLGLSAITFFRSDIRARVSMRQAAWASAAFILGALPLLQYNVAQRGETLRSGVSVGTTQADASYKLRLLLDALEGRALLGYIVRAHEDGVPRGPRGTLEQLSVDLARLAGGLGWTLTPVLLAITLLSLPWLKDRRCRVALQWLWVALVIAYAQMFIAKELGMGGCIT